jgi:deoxyribonuclease-4
MRPIDKTDLVAMNSSDIKVGVHVSIGGSLGNSVDNAKLLGCNAFQIFTRNPRGWTAPVLSAKECDGFRKKVKESKIDPNAIVAHMPYPPNFSSPEKTSFKKSTQSLIDETKRSSQLGIPYLVAHLGSHKGAGSMKGIVSVVDAFCKAAKETPDNVTILLENNSGGKDSVGSNFEEFAKIFLQLEPMGRFGICFDTCHAFTAGYDISTKLLASQSWNKFLNLVGLENIKLIHLNDSRGEIGCGTDIHEHVGLGRIGKEGLSFFTRFAKSHSIPLILETPIDERYNDLDNLKEARSFV